MSGAFTEIRESNALEEMHSRRRRRIDILFPALPPALDGIGDYTAGIAREMGKHFDVRVLTAQVDAREIPGVTVQRVFNLDRRRDILNVLPSVIANPPEWIVLQFNQFSYGQWGLNPFLPLLMHRIRRVAPQVKIAWMVHEDFVPITSWKFAIMTLWQRWQFWSLGKAAHQIWFSIEPWMARYRTWFPEKPFVHMPPASNIPVTDCTRDQAREVIGIRKEKLVLGIFGTASPVRLLTYIRAAGEALTREGLDFILLYIGPDGSRVREVLGNLPLHDAGRLSEDEVSRHFAAMDVYLAPFSDGVSTRRSSFMVGVQHGVPTVGTDGEATDTILRNTDGRAFLLPAAGDEEAFVLQVIRLCKDPDLRRRISEGGASFYEKEFSKSALVARIVNAIDSSTYSAIKPFNS